MNKCIKVQEIECPLLLACIPGQCNELLRWERGKEIKSLLVSGPGKKIINTAE